VTKRFDPADVDADTSSTETEDECLPPPRILKGKRAVEVDEDGLTREEAAALERARLRPRPGWSLAPGETDWRKEGCSYIVRFTAKRRKWSAEVAPFQILNPEGVPLGGNSHLSRAQRTAEMLSVPLHDARSEVRLTSTMRLADLPRFEDEPEEPLAAGGRRRKKLAIP